ncbi:hypothetical protein BS50DRAFT_619792 [Corynespora cassiicola Philippines]|uniref:Uncharacterized protein n=1 Tax=Corynespora cassiicola Philippines TaxID=1448308 RepID=A0A2T2NUR4_CORCC|nr:hypothetical protein BS50DRAFT_619792 [Corynespora cassiicola Philippines]
MGNEVSKFVKNAVEHVKETIVDMHPVRAVFHIVKGILVLAPGIIAGPVLALAGFTGAGVAAGSIAAGVQSLMRTVTAGSTFATLQSAAMGGYGTSAVAEVVRGAVIASEARARFRERGT